MARPAVPVGGRFPDQPEDSVTRVVEFDQLRDLGRACCARRRHRYAHRFAERAELCRCTDGAGRFVVDEVNAGLLTLPSYGSRVESEFDSGIPEPRLGPREIVSADPTLTNNWTLVL